MATSENRNNTVSETDIIHTLQGTDRPVMTVADLQEHLNHGHTTLRRHCRRMAENGQIQQIKVGNACAFYIQEGSDS